jgi:urease accessory protein
MSTNKASFSPHCLAALLQTGDNLFPSGGYAHSYGLEEMVSIGRIKNAEDLEDFLKDEVLQCMANLELPYLRYSQMAAEKKDINELLIMNEEISAWKLTREVREAGQAQGMQLIRIIKELYDDEWTECFAEKLRSTGESCQHIVATALLRNIQSVPQESSFVSWIYQGVSNFASASVKLLRLGEVACQRVILRSLESDSFKKTISKAFSVKRNEAGWFNPLLDIASCRHELAFSRLFIS